MDRSKQHFDESDIPKLVRELPSVEADAGFRERLRNAFAQGRLETELPDEGEAGRGKPHVDWLRWLVPVAATAVLLIVVATLNRPPDLRVLQVKGQGEVRIDGHPATMEDVSTLSADLRAGVEVESPPEALIDLLAKDVLLVEIVGGTRMSIPQMPGRWFGREEACSLYVGEIRVKTGKRFPGKKLLVYTPEGIVEIAGTMLSVQRDSGGTCVCVLEGTVYVGVDQEDIQPVKPGYRKIMLRDGTVEIIPVKPMHRDGVLDFDNRVGHRIEYER